MSSLNNEQKQLLFDYCIGVTSQEENIQAQQLISSNPQAAQLYATMKSVLSPLDTVEPALCPEELAEATIFRLKNAARTSQLHLEKLLADEQAKTTAQKGGFWAGFGSRLARAAVFIVVGSVAISTWKITSNYARENARKIQCQAKLGDIFNGIANYKTEHGGKGPQLATSVGQPWWKVGYQGDENHSNTRHMWLLVKQGYLDPNVFICPGGKGARRLHIDRSQIKMLYDFPSREYVGYSFRVMCNKPVKGSSHGPRAMMADLSPLFETLPSFSSTLQIQLDKALASRNSINHKRRGQNVLFCDGAVRFVRKRCVDITMDDIFTLHDRQFYQGHEVPSCQADQFLAP